ncbi:MAG: hypothetical protein OIF48_03860 [Silicimonas sp.]|nr:hypothetical protein [Silicimonas sp.]
MRTLLALLATATPALAHGTALPHSHAADWTVPAAVALIAVAVLATRARK